MCSVVRSELLTKFRARSLASHPYHYRSWCISAEESLEAAEHLNDTVKVYYLSKYWAPSQLTRILTHVPYICVSSDKHIITQDQSRFGSVEKAREIFEYLITNEERRLSRNKCVASLAKVFAVGGYGNLLRPLRKDEIFECIIVSGAEPQFEAIYMDFQDFIVANNKHTRRLSQYNHFGELPMNWSGALEACEEGSNFTLLGTDDYAFHHTAYLTSMTECMHLWLKAFDDLVGRFGGGRNGYMKISAIGTGFFADVAGLYTNIGNILMPLILKAVAQAILDHEYTNIVALEFPDFSINGLFTPKESSIRGIELLAAPYRDVLDFSSKTKQKYMVGLLNPGDCFSCVGNELGYSSVEAMIGNNTTVRSTQCYIWNERILDSDNWIAVE